MTKRTVIRFNLDGLETLIAEIGAYRARVGILGSKAARTQGNGIDNVTLGIIQIFGSVTKNIPPRDFLLMPIEVNKRELVQSMSTQSVREAIASGDIKKAYTLLGIKAEQFVQEAFETSGFGNWPPNAPATIRLKGSDRPLIDTGELRRAVSSDVVKRSEAV